MPSALHEALIEIFRKRDRLAVELLARVFGAEVPGFDEVRVGNSDRSQPRPPEAREDLTQVLERDGKAVLGLVIEPQLAVKPEKKLKWPVYVTTFRAEHGCLVELVVVTVSASVARWAAEPIEVMPGQFLRPRVLGPGSMPVLTAAEQQTAAVEMGVLSAISNPSHPEARGLFLGSALRLDELDDELRAIVYDVLMAEAPEAVRKELEAMALSGNYEFQSPLGKKLVAQGEEIGEHRMQVRMLLRLLQHRGFAVDEGLRARLDAASSDELERWHLRAADGEDLEAIFRD